MEFYFQMLITRAKLRPFALSVESCSVVQLQSFIESPTYNVYKQVYMRKCIFEVFIVGKSFQTGQKQCAHPCVTSTNQRYVKYQVFYISGDKNKCIVSCSIFQNLFSVYEFNSQRSQGFTAMLLEQQQQQKKSFRPKYKQIICQNVSGNNNQRVSLMLIHLYILSLTKKKIIMNITKLGVFSFCPLVDFTVEMIQISSDLVKECTRSE